MSDEVKISIDNQRYLLFTKTEYDAASAAYGKAISHMSGSFASTEPEWLRANYPKNFIVCPYPIMTKDEFFRLYDEEADIGCGSANHFIHGFFGYVRMQSSSQAASMNSLVAQFADIKKAGNGKKIMAMLWGITETEVDDRLAVLNDPKREAYEMAAVKLEKDGTADRYIQVGKQRYYVLWDGAVPAEPKTRKRARPAHNRSAQSVQPA